MSKVSRGEVERREGQGRSKGKGGTGHRGRRKCRANIN